MTAQQREEYLPSRGWRPTSTRRPLWIDPIDRTIRLPAVVALTWQRRSDARRRELAQPSTASRIATSRSTRKPASVG